MRFLVLSLLLAPALAFADPTPAKDVQQMHTDDCAKARKQNKTCVLDMGKDEITTDRPVEQEVKVDVLQFGRAGSLIHIRRDFIVEILKSVEDL